MYKKIIYEIFPIDGKLNNCILIARGSPPGVATPGRIPAGNRAKNHRFFGWAAIRLSGEVIYEGTYWECLFQKLKQESHAESARQEPAICPD